MTLQKSCRAIRANWGDRSRKLSSACRRVLGPATFLVLSPVAVLAESDAGEVSRDDAVGVRNGSFVAVPLPFNDPTFGTGLALGGGYLFKTDEGSNTSFVGLAGLGTNSGSYGGALAGNLSFDENRLNASLYLGAVDLNYDLFVGGTPRNITQESLGFFGEFRYGFSKSLSAGITMRYLDTRLSRDDARSLPDEISNLKESVLGTMGVVVQWDTRDDNFYPTQGTFAAFDLSMTDEYGGLARTYEKATLELAHHWPVGKRGVFAARVAGCHTGQDVPFFDSCLLGGPQGIRGFSMFEFYGDQLASLQGEYRGRIGERFGYVAFAGMGEVQRTSISLDSGVGYAGGVGLRYQVSKDFDLDLSLDVTLNDQNEELLYLYVGQAF